MASLADLRDALTALGVSTSTGSLRGEERRLLLQQRLYEAQRKVVSSPPEASQSSEKAKKTEHARGLDSHALTLSELREELDARQLPTQTPGLKGEARRHALLQRLLNASDGEPKKTQEPQRPEAWHPVNDGSTSSRSSSSSYSAAGEFLFFDLLSGDRSKAFEPTTPAIPALNLPVSPTKRPLIQAKADSYAVASSSEVDSCLVREQLERELIGFRQQLHQHRTARSLSISKRLKEAGFPQDLDKLSASMQQLETERQRIQRVAFAHELVTTTAIISGSPVELVQEDAVRLIENRQIHLRQQIQGIKDAMAIVKQQQDADHVDRDSEAEIHAAIRRIQLQLQLYQPSCRSTEASIDQDTGRSLSSCFSASSSSSWLSPHDAPVLTRCRSMPLNKFHQTWDELDDSQRQQLHLELKAAKSFRIRHDRIRVGDETNKAITTRSAPGTTTNAVGRQGILAFTRYPPTAADKLGVKAFFLEQSGRSLLETQRVYQQALALEPHHAIILGNYAWFLYRKCGQLDQADHHFNQAIRADPLCMATIANYARFLHRTQRDLVKAEELYIQLLRISPRDAALLGNYASLLLQQAKKSSTGRSSQLMQAKQCLLQAIDINPHDVSNRLRLCAVYEQLRETEQAHSCYESLVKDVAPVPFNHDNQDSSETPRTATMVALVAHVYGNFANFLQRSGQLEKAKVIYEAALNLHPEDKLLQRNFSMLLRGFNTARKQSARREEETTLVGPGLPVGLHVMQR